MKYIKIKILNIKHPTFFSVKPSLGSVGVSSEEPKSVD